MATRYRYNDEIGGSGGVLMKFGIMLLYFLLILVASTNGFNIDLENVMEYHGESQSMFGFSVAEHKELGRSWVLIGAPEMTDPSLGPDYRGGALYYCNAQQSNSCHMIPAKSYNHSQNHNIHDNDTMQWLGATVRSSGENGAILICAPRYFWYRTPGNGFTNRDPVGTCFISNTFSTFEEYSPCRNRNYGHGKQGSCQVGFGAALAKGRVYLGAVGSYYWQGQLISILYTHLKLPYSFEDHKISLDLETGQVFSQSIYNSPDFMITKEGPKTTDDSYMGYSVASIAYLSRSMKIAGVVTGIPRADHMAGRVTFMTWNLTDVKSIVGEQFASYFGYAVCVADVDGDGADDVIVGAPMYSDYNNPNKIDYERGRVYVFYQTTRPCESADTECWSKKYANNDILDGEHSKSRFGLSVASLGDINQDGYDDFVVGAPYEGLGGGCTKSTVTGAVYIYHGSKSGVREKYSQVIRAAELSRRDFGLTTFGFSLSGGMDMDNNMYPDLVVGAYESDSVYLFNSRPVIQLDANLTFESRTKMIGLNDNNCWLKNNVHVSCVPLNLCMRYDGIGIDDQIILHIQITLDTKQTIAPRMFFLDDEGYNQFKDNIPLRKGGTLCKTLKTYIARLRPTQDRLTPLEAELKYQLKEQNYTRRGVLTPVLSMDDETPLTRTDRMNIKNNCGSDNVCKPNLRMEVQSNVKQYILGSGNLVMNTTVQNLEEDSFGTVFKMRVPPGVSYSRFEDLTYPRTDFSVQCYPTRREDNIINCDIGNPLPTAGKVKFSIILEPNAAVEEPQFDFWFNVTTSNPQVSARMQSQEHVLTISIREETSLQINGVSTQTLHYNASQYEQEKVTSDIEAGPFIRHEYIIKNLGPSEILEADVMFDWPSQLSTGEDLLYLISQPLTEGSIKCDSHVPNVNYRHLQIQRKFNERYTEYDKLTSQSEIISSGNEIIQSASKETQNIGSSVHQVKQGNQKRPNVGLSVNHINQEIYKQSIVGTDLQGSNYYEKEHIVHTSESHQQQGNSHGSHQGPGGIYQQVGSQSSFHGSGGIYQQDRYPTSSRESGGIYQQGSSRSSSHASDVIYQHGSSQSASHGSGGTYYHSSYPGSSHGSDDIYPQGGYQNSTYGSGSIYEQAGSQSSSHESGVSYQQPGSYGVNQQSGITQQIDQSSWAHGGQNNYHQGSNVNNVYTKGRSQWTLGGNYEGQQHLDDRGSFQAGKNYSTVHEAETAYHKDTIKNNGNVNTYIEGKWRTNDNGVVKNGSFSTVRPGIGYDYTLQENVGGIFEGRRNIPMYTGGEQKGHDSVNVNTGNGRGTVIHKQRVGDNILTTVDEGTYYSSPEVKVRGNESEDVYHYKGGSVKFMKPIKLPDNVVVPKKWNVPGQEVPYKNEEQNLPLMHSSQDDEASDDDVVEEGEGDENSYDEEEAVSDVKNNIRSRRATVSFENGKDFCTMSSCIKIRCTIGRLAKDAEASVIFPAIVWARTIKKIAFNRPVVIGSYVEVNITKLPHIKMPNVTYTSEILTNVTSLDYGKTPPDVIPLWIVVVSACLGTLILMLLVFLLYKSGFFKRTRPPHAPERQPLNRNGGGYQNGDEAL